MATAPPVAPVAPTPTPTPASTSPLHQVKGELGLYSGSDLGQVVRAIPIKTYVVEGLLPRASVNLMVGDSGIGKSPLAYQLAISVAAGMPFLDLAVSPASKVLLVDFENAIYDSHWILEQQRKHLRLTAFPDNFLLWPAHMRSEPDLDRAVLRMAPDLVIVDSLRSFNPKMESDNATASAQINRLRQMAARFGTTFLLVHHLRKRGVSRDRNLEAGTALEWLEQTAGAHAIINQSDVRLAVSRPIARKDVALILRGHGRTRGEIGPFLLQRRYDADGDPTGYVRLKATPSLLGNPEQEAVWKALPDAFTFRDARLALDAHHETANRFLHDLVRLGLAVRTSHGRYEKKVCV